MPKRFVVGIVGAGHIAQGFDSPKSRDILTMAHAIQRSRDFTLGGFFDVDAKKAKAAERKWRSPESPRHRREWFDHGWDVIYIATPDRQHVADVKSALAAGVKGVLVEKPLAPRLGDARELLLRARRSKTAILVNYPRRWHSGAKRVAQRIRRGEFGELLHADMVVSRGRVHNGVHAVDFMRHLWGGGWNIVGGRSGMIHWRRGKRSATVSLTHLPVRHSVFEVRAYGGRGSVALEGSPERLTCSRVVPDARFQGFQTQRITEAFDMEREPLMLRTLERLAILMRNASERLKQIDVELENERMIAETFDHLGREYQ